MSDATDSQSSNTPTRQARFAFAVGMTVVTAWYVYTRSVGDPQLRSDFDQVWYAAQALWNGQDPYQLIGLEKPFAWKWPFYYPLPAVILVAPVGLLGVVAARCVFAALSVGLLAWFLTRDNWVRVPAFLSMTFLVSVQLVQWSPLLTAALLAPSLGWVGVAKPNWAIAIFASATHLRTWVAMLAGGAILTVVALIAQPTWIGTWWSIVQTATHFRTPIFLPLGFLMLAAALRWKRPEARLLIAIACLPQTPGFYDALMLFTIPRTVRESLLLVVASYVVFFAMAYRGPWPTDAAWMGDIARFTLWFMYLPCVVMVLRRRNEGMLPLGPRAVASVTAP